MNTERRKSKSIIGKPSRLYVKAVFSGFRREKSTQDENHTLIHIGDLNSRKEAQYYLGKRIIYV